MFDSKKISIFILLLLMYKYVYAQDISVEISNDDILIGEQIDLNITVKAKKADKVIFPDISERILPFEVVKSSKLDSIYKDDFVEYIKKYKLTTFDSGYHEIKPFKFLINNETKTTPPRKILVNTVEVDTVKKKIYDIKRNLVPSYSIYNDYKYVIFLIIFLIILAILIYFLLRRKNKKPKKIIKIKQTPYEEAIEKLNILKDAKLIERREYKKHYSMLTDLLRVYFEKVLGFKAMELTSDEILSEIREKNLPDNIISKLSLVLHNSDLVKFAKLMPNDNISKSDIEYVEYIINSLNKQEKENEDIQ